MRTRSPRSAVGGALAAALAVLVVLVGGVAGYQQLAKGGCADRLELSVAAAPEIAPAVQEVAAKLAGSGANVNGTCIAFVVSAAEPADVAATVASGLGLTLTGVGLPSGSMQLPDVWIPDAATWLARLSAAETFAPAATPSSIASSPVVVAMPEPVAAGLGWPEAKITWSALLATMSSSGSLNVGIVEPTRDAAGLAGLLALGQAAAASEGGTAAATGMLRSLAAGRSALRQDVLARFPRSMEPSVLGSSLSAAALSEQAVITFNATQPPVPLAALYLEPAPPALDYPFTVLAQDSLRTAAASELRAALLTPAFREQLAGHGLRGPDGTGGAPFATPTGAPESLALAANASDPAVLQKALSTWAAITLPARMLAIVDVSGSMLRAVPTAGGATRAQVTAEAARIGLSLFDDSWAVGLWTFSTELDGATDHKELVPVGPVVNQRAALLTALSSVQPKPSGDTGLYDTILAGYQHMQEGWDPSRINSIVMLTDGDNDDGNGIALEQLLAKLGEIGDPQKPIQVIIIGIGPEVTPGPLEEITNATGGGVFIAEDPANIGEIFLKAISLRGGDGS